MTVQARIFLILGFFAAVVVLLGFFVYTHKVEISEQKDIKEQQVRQVRVLTSDGVSIGADYTRSSKEYGVILIHDIGGNASDWGDTNDILVKYGFSVLAIDLRGHGRSSGDYTAFTSRDFQAMKYDILAGYNFLKSRNKDMSISLMGAGFGANLAIAVTNDSLLSGSIANLLLFSPTTEARGINTSTYMQLYSNPVLIVASKQDTIAFQSSESLFFGSPTNDRLKKFVALEGAQNGVGMLTSQLKRSIVEWLRTVTYFVEGKTPGSTLDETINTIKFN